MIDDQKREQFGRIDTVTKTKWQQTIGTQRMVDQITGLHITIIQIPIGMNLTQQ